ncbi:hypothetical protein HOLleu_33513 [Holothuria leucospilota]|uniref:Uncharacterized protein n=1 Tax=Holothuria leucospilota TaxID=206669 RepID=A0A9Q0YS41_HOLLE|nr:hypothetical protein HOLleu_33513 [Holothuria leucospilota]
MRLSFRLSFSLSEIRLEGTYMRLLLYSPFWSLKSSYDENLASRSPRLHTFHSSTQI